MGASDRPVVLKADPAYRRRALLVYALGVPLALALFVLFRHWGLPMVVEHLRRSGDEALRLFKLIGIVSMALPSAPASTCFASAVASRSASRCRCPEPR